MAAGSASMPVVLERLAAAQAEGYLGPAPIADQVAHSLAFADACGPAPQRALDLGSGGGLPGLVLAALAWPSTRWVLLDAGARRTDFLADAVQRLDLDDRVEVDRRRAEVAAHAPDRRGRFDAVVVRSFPGGPGVAAECAAGFLGPGGALVVSEPPPQAPDGAGADRWPAEPLAALGLVVEELVAVPNRFVRLRRVGPVPSDRPRRTGVPTKRPAF